MTPGGYFGRALVVDLDGPRAVLELEEDVLRARIGGRLGRAVGLFARGGLAALDALEALVARLQGGDSADAQTRASAAGVVRHFSTTVRQHHDDEERHVFPKLALSAQPHIVEAVLRLQRDHDWLEEDWMEISPHVDAIASGQSWYDIDVLREGTAIFAALSRDHIALEVSLLYPEVKSRLRPGDRREMGREMAARRRAARKGAHSDGES
jgi:hemerythrin-like domain-containing protein